MGNRYMELRAENERLQNIVAALLAWCESQTREDGHWIECPCPPGYDHKYMPHSEAVRICTNLQDAIAGCRRDALINELLEEQTWQRP